MEGTASLDHVESGLDTRNGLAQKVLDSSLPIPKKPRGESIVVQLSNCLDGDTEKT